MILELRQIPGPLLEALSSLDTRLFGAAAWGREGFLRSAGQAYDHLLVCVEKELEELPGKNEARDCRLLGYALLRVLDDAELLQIGVNEECRRRGIGRALLRESLRLADEKNVFLEVREGNGPARGLYANCGFSEIGRRKRYYTDPQEDAVLMERKFCGKILK